MRVQWKKLILFMVIPLAVGAAASILTNNRMDAFGRLNRPPLSPPQWVFPVVWTILYLMMGYAAYRVATSEHSAPSINSALRVYYVQLAFNFLWTLIFFMLEVYVIAFVWLVILWLLILWTLVLFARLSKPAGWLMAPYLAWTAFAGYLNAGIMLLNG